MNSKNLTIEFFEKMLGKKIKVDFSSLKKPRIGYLIDIYKDRKTKEPVIVLELSFGKYEDRKLSKVKSVEELS